MCVVATRRLAAATASGHVIAQELRAAHPQSVVTDHDDGPRIEVVRDDSAGCHA